jgi:hypothetical protein
VESDLTIEPATTLEAQLDVLKTLTVLGIACKPTPKVAPYVHPKLQAVAMALGRFSARPRAPAIGVDSVRRLGLINLVSRGTSRRQAYRAAGGGAGLAEPAL